MIRFQPLALGLQLSLSVILVGARLKSIHYITFLRRTRDSSHTRQYNKPHPNTPQDRHAPVSIIRHPLWELNSPPGSILDLG
ncbi:hypothetical protein EV426DRAFT_296652 [Tirmania nivea]|nr:hypothetical protein EV426DRAFT_296652 [Tirmania nivea]